MAIEPLAELRARTAVLHRQLESAPAFARLLQANVAPADVAQALSHFHAFYAGLEASLLPRVQGSPLASLYRPRQALLAADLATLGQMPSAPLPLALPAGDAGLLGVIYAVEGSALGGQVLNRHLRSCLGDEFAASLQYFSRLAEGVGSHWQQVLDSLRRTLVEPGRLDEVGAGADLVFAALIRLAGVGLPAAAERPE